MRARQHVADGRMRAAGLVPDLLQQVSDCQSRVQALQAQVENLEQRQAALGPLNEVCRSSLQTPEDLAIYNLRLEIVNFQLVLDRYSEETVEALSQVHSRIDNQWLRITALEAELSLCKFILHQVLQRSDTTDAEPILIDLHALD